MELRHVFVLACVVLQALPLACVAANKICCAVTRVVIGQVEPKIVFARASDRVVKGVQEAHWDEEVSPEHQLRT